MQGDNVEDIGCPYDRRDRVVFVQRFPIADTEAHPSVKLSISIATLSIVIVYDWDCHGDRLSYRYESNRARSRPLIGSANQVGLRDKSHCSTVRGPPPCES